MSQRSAIGHESSNLMEHAAGCGIRQQPSFAVLMLIVMVTCSTSGCNQPSATPQTPVPRHPMAAEKSPSKTPTSRSVDTPTVNTQTVDSPIAPQQQSQSAVADPVQLHDDALQALESGDSATAFQLVRAARALTPEDPQTLFLLARVLAERNRFAEAVKLLDDLAETVPDARLPVLGQTAEWLTFQGQWQQAEDRYRSLLQQVPDASRAHQMLADLLLRQGRRLLAAEHLRTLCRSGVIQESNLRTLLMIDRPFAGDASAQRSDPIGPLGQARQQMGLGQWEVAAETLDRANSQQPDVVAASGRIAAALDDFGKLESWTVGVPQSAKDTADYWLAMATLRSQQDDHRSAAMCCCRTVLLDPTAAPAYHLLSKSLGQLAMSDHAERAQQRAGLLEQTQKIGRAFAETQTPDSTQLAELVDLLEQLQRPIEALAWRAVGVSYAKTSGALTDQEASQAIAEINRQRIQQLTANPDGPSEAFVVCEVDLETLSEGEQD
ncbi:tetratricopeptide repeat protein [Stieleria sp. TO1_6]|uniref:tetratricopeptide repeat protein n=1 Tax=Stieleria tagensis TaxID=2956795 RepID=UPI00209AE8DC|nr:tetratricopeptide repeat protein [Stieleria tagensis]MCO8122294.1 tetratricopeptide repeat protein [Stieleria tagensis]